jgi:hypothetical protein
VTEETSPPTPMRPCDCMGPFTCVAMAAILLQPHPYTVHIMSLLADCHGLLHGAAAPHEAAAHAVHAESQLSGARERRQRHTGRTATPCLPDDDVTPIHSTHHAVAGRLPWASSWGCCTTRGCRHAVHVEP